MTDTSMITRLQQLNLPLPIFEQWSKNDVEAELSRLGSTYSCMELEVMERLVRRDGEERERHHRDIHVEAATKADMIAAAYRLVLGYGPIHSDGEKAFTVRIAPERMQIMLGMMYAKADMIAADLIEDPAAMEYALRDYAYWAGELQGALERGEFDRANDVAKNVNVLAGALARIQRLYEETAELETL